MGMCCGDYCAFCFVCLCPHFFCLLFTVYMCTFLMLTGSNMWLSIVDTKVMANHRYGERETPMFEIWLYP